MTYQLPEPGQYQGTVISAAFTESKNGTNKVDIVLQVGDRTATAYLYLTEKAEQRSMDVLKFLGWNGDVENPVFTNGENVTVSCKHEEYEGKTRAKWDIYPPRGADPAKIKDFASRFRAITKTPPPKPVGRPAPTPSRATPPRRSAESEAASPMMLTDDGTWDNDSAWAEWQANRAEKDTDATLQARYLDRLDRLERSSGKKEAQFTSAEWCKVANEAHIPF